VATGGTISNRDGGRLTAEELAKSMPGVDRDARLAFEQFANVASSELTLQQWLGLSKRINELFANEKDELQLTLFACAHQRVLVSRDDLIDVGAAIQEECAPVTASAILAAATVSTIATARTGATVSTTRPAAPMAPAIRPSPARPRRCRSSSTADTRVERSLRFALRTRPPGSARGLRTKAGRPGGFGEGATAR
jgi:Asparaginase, N-terminal